MHSQQYVKYPHSKLNRDTILRCRIARSKYQQKRQDKQEYLRTELKIVKKKKKKGKGKFNYIKKGNLHSIRVIEFNSSMINNSVQDILKVNASTQRIPSRCNENISYTKLSFEQSPQKRTQSQSPPHLSVNCNSTDDTQRNNQFILQISQMSQSIMNNVGVKVVSEQYKMQENEIDSNQHHSRSHFRSFASIDDEYGLHSITNKITDSLQSQAVSYPYNTFSASKIEEEKKNYPSSRIDTQFSSQKQYLNSMLNTRIPNIKNQEGGIFHPIKEASVPFGILSYSDMKTNSSTEINSNHMTNITQYLKNQQYLARQDTEPKQDKSTNQPQSNYLPSVPAFPCSFTGLKPENPIHLTDQKSTLCGSNQQFFDPDHQNYKQTPLNSFQTQFSTQDDRIGRTTLHTLEIPSQDKQIRTLNCQDLMNKYALIQRTMIQNELQGDSQQKENEKINRNQQLESQEFQTSSSLPSLIPSDHKITNQHTSCYTNYVPETKNIPSLSIATEPFKNSLKDISPVLDNKTMETQTFQNEPSLLMAQMNATKDLINKYLSSKQTPNQIVPFSQQVNQFSSVDKMSLNSQGLIASLEGTNLKQPGLIASLEGNNLKQPGLIASLHSNKLKQPGPIASLDGNKLKQPELIVSLDGNKLKERHIIPVPDQSNIVKDENCENRGITMNSRIQKFENPQTILMMNGDQNSKVISDLDNSRMHTQTEQKSNVIEKISNSQFDSNDMREHERNEKVNDQIKTNYSGNVQQIPCISVQQNNLSAHSKLIAQRDNKPRIKSVHQIPPKNNVFQLYKNILSTNNQAIQSAPKQTMNSQESEEKVQTSRIMKQPFLTPQQQSGSQKQSNLIKQSGINSKTPQIHAIMNHLNSRNPLNYGIIHTVQKTQDPHPNWRGQGIQNKSPVAQPMQKKSPPKQEQIINRIRSSQSALDSSSLSSLMNKNSKPENSNYKQKIWQDIIEQRKTKLNSVHSSNNQTSSATIKNKNLNKSTEYKVHKQFEKAFSKPITQVREYQNVMYNQYGQPVNCIENIRQNKLMENPKQSALTSSQRNHFDYVHSTGYQSEQKALVKSLEISSLFPQPVEHPFQATNPSFSQQAHLEAMQKSEEGHLKTLPAINLEVVNNANDPNKERVFYGDVKVMTFQKLPENFNGSPTSDQNSPDFLSSNHISFFSPSKRVQMRSISQRQESHLHQDQTPNYFYDILNTPQDNTFNPSKIKENLNLAMRMSFGGYCQSTSVQ